MTAAVYRSGAPSFDVPKTQDTALVLEFNCLYTRDIRRKQKRWQDGFLRFHTFNKRVMVYDVPRNFIGDTHWKETQPLQEGDDVVLEKDGIIVQVENSVGRTETDLTELRKSTRKKSSSDYASSSPARGVQMPPPPRLSAVASRPTIQLKHRSLNGLLGTPKGAIGKAKLPTKSPFEERHAQLENEQWEDGRSAKRQRVEQPLVWSVARTSTKADTSKRKETPLSARTVDSQNARKPGTEGGQQRLESEQVIDLTEDPEEESDHDGLSSAFLSDVVDAPSSPAKQLRQLMPPTAARSSSPAFQTQRLAEKPRQSEKREEPDVQDRRRNPQVAESDSWSQAVDIDEFEPPVKTARTRLVVHNPESQRTHEIRPAIETDAGSEMSSGSRKTKPGRTLKIAASAPKRKLLLFQEQLSKNPSRSRSTSSENIISVIRRSTSMDSQLENAEPTKQSKKRTSQAEKTNGRTESEYTGALASNFDTLIMPLPKKTPRKTLEPMPQSTFDMNAEELAQLDQLIMPPPRQRSTEIISAPVPPVEKPEIHIKKSQTKKASTRPKRAPGAPVRYTPTPSPTKKPPSAARAAAPNIERDSPAPRAAPPPPKSRGKKSGKPTVSLNTTSNGTSTVILARPFQRPKSAASKDPPLPLEKAANAWSREAFDLFTWRPPGWDEDEWCVKAPDSAASEGVA